MFSRIIPVVLSALLASSLLPQVALCAPIDEWNAIVTEGSKFKFDGKYDIAVQSFTKAVSFAEKQKLPDKCLPISLCRLAEVELITNNVKEADSHFEKIISLIKTQKNANTLDPQVNFWAAGLADAYQSYRKPDTRELCLKHACYLKTLVYGTNHKECLDCLSKLAECYIDENKVDKAIEALSFRQALLDKKYGKVPDALGDTLNDLALKCEKEQKYKQARQLELAVIKIAPTNIGSVNAGLPAFYSFLGMNALEQGKTNESKEYFQKALKECSKIKGKLKTQWLGKYLFCLPALVCADDPKHKKSVIEEVEYRHLLAMANAANIINLKYDVLNSLSNLLYETNVRDERNIRVSEAIECLKKCIEIANNPLSDKKETLPDLYIRLGGYQIYLHNFDRAEQLYNKALSVNPDKNGYEAAIIFFWWGKNFNYINRPDLAAEKLNIAFKRASALPPEKRGTLLADLIEMLAYRAHDYGDAKSAHELFKQSTAEIQLQKKLHSKLGPDMFNRM